MARYCKGVRRSGSRAQGASLNIGVNQCLVKTVRLKIDRAGEALSGQIETDADVEVLDRNMHIATVSEGGKLSIEMR
ncbi:MAG: hypothetical protein HY820_44165, partial [Acidobacteria bacterium]|nr:hypothetical protein [Acidobacteriota bacterium]